MKPTIFLYFGAILLFLLQSCSATNRLSMTVTQPAMVDLGPGVQRIGIINRSVASEKNDALDKIEKILSAEGMKLDKEGAEAAIEGLADQLRSTYNYEVVAVLEDTPDLNKGLKILPAPLTQKQVQDLCARYKLDAVFSLAFYDTDTKARYSMGKMKVPNAVGLNIEVPAHQLELNSILRNGWRIYIPDALLPLDEQIYRDAFVTSGSGINPIDAYNSIPNRKERVIGLSREIGLAHGMRLEPRRIRVGRDYFVRGSDRLVRGKRRAQTGDWNGAAQLWEQDLGHIKTKVAGRAHFNMAVINEINGNLEAAIEWASRSYTEFNNREALRYVNILKQRFAEQHELEAQLSR